MTKEYISRDEMIKQAKARIVLGAPKFNTGLEAAIEVATSIPAADVVEVVRCRECVYRIAYGCKRIGGISTPPNWYCAAGERRDGGQRT